MKERGVPPPTSHLPPFALELTNFNQGKGEQNFNEKAFQQTSAGPIEKVSREVLTAGWPLFSGAIGG